MKLFLLFRYTLWSLLFLSRNFCFSQYLGHKSFSYAFWKRREVVCNFFHDSKCYTRVPAGFLLSNLVETVAFLFNTSLCFSYCLLQSSNIGVKGFKIFCNEDSSYLRSYLIVQHCPHNPYCQVERLQL